MSVAPIYTLSNFYTKSMDTDRLRKNDYRGVLYLEPDQFYPNERFVALGERFPTYERLLDPKPEELTEEGISMLDARLAQLDQLYQDATEYGGFLVT